MKRLNIPVILLAASLLLSGCAAAPATESEAPLAAETADTGSSSAASPLSAETIFSARDLDVGFEADSAAYISFDGSSAAVESYGDCSESGISISSGSVTITEEGSYVLYGSGEDMQLVVELLNTEKLQLIFKDLSLSCSDGPAVYIKQADKVFITLAEDSVNSLSDGESYALESGEDEPNACLFSKADLTINGGGSLEIAASYNHGIFSKDDLSIVSGSYDITAANDGIKGKDCIQIKDGVFTISAGGDALQSSNSSDAGRGYVYIEGGVFTLESAGDGIQAETSLEILGGAFDIVTGGGSASAPVSESESWGGRGGQQETATEDSVSTKGLKGGSSVLISGGSFTLDCCDDAVHSNGDATIQGGELYIRTGDDGMHADSSLTIENGQIDIAQSYEGLEGLTVTISGGEIDIYATDDGINSAGGSDSVMTGGFFGRDSFSGGSEDCFIEINGGLINVHAGGDGLDSNGRLTVNGGEIYVCGGESGGNAALDCDGTPVINGGRVVAAGSSMMAMGFDASSAQCSIMYTFTGSHQAGEEVRLCDSEGNVLLSCAPGISYNNVVISCPELELNGSYSLTAGDETVQITPDSVSYSNGTGGMGGFGGGRGNPGGERPQSPEGFEMPEGGMQPPEGFEIPEGGMQPPEGFGLPEGEMQPPEGGFGGRGPQDGASEPNGIAAQ